MTIKINLISAFVYPDKSLLSIFKTFFFLYKAPPLPQLYVLRLETQLVEVVFNGIKKHVFDVAGHTCIIV